MCVDLKAEAQRGDKRQKPAALHHRCRRLGAQQEPHLQGTDGQTDSGVGGVYWLPLERSHSQQVLLGPPPCVYR